MTSSDEVEGRALSEMQWAVLEHVGNVCGLRADGRYGAIDLNTLDGRRRDAIIDLAMHDPPLVDVDGPRALITEHGKALIRARREASESSISPAPNTMSDPGEKP